MRNALAVASALALTLALLVFATLVSGCGGGGGGPTTFALDTSFANVEAPGFLETDIQSDLNSNVYFLGEAEVVAFDEVTYRITVNNQAGYLAGDILVFGWSGAQTAVQVIALYSTVGIEDTFSCGQVQQMSDIFTPNGISFAVTPDFSVPITKAGFGPPAKLVEDKALSPNAIDLSGLSLFEIKIKPDGTIDELASSLMGITFAGTKDDGEVHIGDTSDVLGGFLKGTITAGILDVIPTATYIWEPLSANGIHATVDAIVKYSLTVEMETSGIIDFNYSMPLVPPLTLVIPTPVVGIPITATLEIPAGFNFHSDTNGIATMTYSSEYAYSFAVDFNDNFWAHHRFVWAADSPMGGCMLAECA